MEFTNVDIYKAEQRHSSDKFFSKSHLWYAVGRDGWINAISRGASLIGSSERFRKDDLITICETHEARDLYSMFQPLH